jgi:hypothetical protein
MTTYTEQQRAQATTWKSFTGTLPPAAKHPAPYVDKIGADRGPAYDFCLPREHAALSLLPEVREPALALFAELGIPWHAGVDGGPSNHLLSSQVQCVNALGQMVHDPERLRLAFVDALGTQDVLEIEPGRFLTFEYIGPNDYFNEAPTGSRIRGAHCTSVDAAFLHRTSDGLVELVLLEWKYTESYRARPAEPAKDQVRWERYGAVWSDPDGPILPALPFKQILQEPLYQLVRQQLLAHALEKDRAHGADRVRVVHVSPGGNTAYQQSLQPAHRALGDSVTEVWSKLMRHPDRFVPLDSELFLDEDITSPEYALRYAPDVVVDEAELLSATGAESLLDLEDILYIDDDFDGDLLQLDDGVEVQLGRVGYSLSYPFPVSLLHRTAQRLQSEYEEELEAADDQ